MGLKRKQEIPKTRKKERSKEVLEVFGGGLILSLECQNSHITRPTSPLTPFLASYLNVLTPALWVSLEGYQPWSLAGEPCNLT